LAYYYYVYNSTLLSAACGTPFGMIIVHGESVIPFRWNIKDKAKRNICIVAMYRWSKYHHYQKCRLLRSHWIKCTLRFTTIWRSVCTSKLQGQYNYKQKKRTTKNREMSVMRSYNCAVVDVIIERTTGYEIYLYIDVYVENGKNSHDYTAVPLSSLFVQQPDGVSSNCAGGGKKFFKNQIT